MSRQLSPGEHLADRVCEVLHNDGWSEQRIRAIVRTQLATAMAWKPELQSEAALDKALGNRIRDFAGETLKKYDQHSPENRLWATFMSQVEWAKVGRYFRDDELPPGWQSAADPPPGWSPEPTGTERPPKGTQQT